MQKTKKAESPTVIFDRDKLNEARIKAGFTRLELTAKARISITTLTNAFTGRRLSEQSAFKIADALNIPDYRALI